ncbi:MAG: hypothetical protein JSR51_05345 [Proteobacteria bacterium]|jgi:hypothetical protein|nr:hypothetical protein [Pseudomonadota bacterium]
MADENSNSTKSIIEINSDSYNEATLLLERAHGILDVLYTLAISSESATENLCRGSLSAALDTAIMAIHEATELLAANGTTK